MIWNFSLDYRLFMKDSSLKEFQSEKIENLYCLKKRARHMMIALLFLFLTIWNLEPWAPIVLSAVFLFFSYLAFSSVENLFQKEQYADIIKYASGFVYIEKNFFRVIQTCSVLSLIWCVGGKLLHFKENTLCIGYSVTYIISFMLYIMLYFKNRPLEPFLRYLNKKKRLENFNLDNFNLDNFNDKDETENDE